MDVSAAVTRTLETARGPITLVGRANPDLLARHPLGDGIGAFSHYSRYATEIQGNALVRVAGLPEGRVLVAVHGGRIVAFLTLHPADRELRWGHENFPELLELGGIETSRNYRRLGIAPALMALAFDGGDYDHRIVYATGYTWCWDLDATGLSKGTYREKILALFRRFGFDEHVTDEPNIRFDWCNVLMVRIGPRVSLAAHRRFLDLLFERHAGLAA